LFRRDIALQSTYLFKHALLQDAAYVAPGAQASGDLRVAGNGRFRVSGELRDDPARAICHAGCPCRQAAEGGVAGRHPGPAADQVPAGDQSEDGAGDRHRGPARDPRPRRRGDRVRIGEWPLQIDSGGSIAV